MRRGGRPSARRSALRRLAIESLEPRLALATLSIADAVVVEGNGGAAAVELTVTLSEAGASDVRVDFATLDDTAGGLEVRRIATGLDRPVFATAPPGDSGRLFIAEQHSGRIEILDLAAGDLRTTPFLDLSGLSTGNEQGLLGFAFHPDYATNGFFYVYYTAADRSSNVVRYRVDPGNPDLADAGSATPLLSFAQPQTNHNGGWIGFGADGYLYIASGDGGGGDDNDAGHTSDVGNGQDVVGNLLGKLLRIDVDGDDFPDDATRNYAIPDDNPFVATAGDDEIWAYGLRNPWRASFDRVTGDLYIGDVGQGAQEEIDVEPAGGTGGTNYGWRLREGTAATPGSVGGPLPAGAIDPVYEYGHGSGPEEGFSVTGGYVYRGPIAELAGQYFFADFVTDRLWSFDLAGDDPKEFDGTNSDHFTDWSDLLVPDVGTIDGVASFAEDGAGNLYLLELGGDIYRLESGGDYLPAAGTLTIDAGKTTTTVSVHLLGDRLPEASEHFLVRLASPSGATLGDAEAKVTIGNDDQADLDVDENGATDESSDGRLVLRHLFGFSGDDLTEGAADPAGGRTAADVIDGYLASAATTLLDADANGAADALTDGVVIYRYLNGLRGEGLIADAVDPAGTRTSAAAIAAFLAGFDPDGGEPGVGAARAPAEVAAVTAPGEEAAGVEASLAWSTAAGVQPTFLDAALHPEAGGAHDTARMAWFADFATQREGGGPSGESPVVPRSAGVATQGPRQGDALDGEDAYGNDLFELIAAGGLL